MKEKIIRYKEKMTEFFRQMSKKQKIILFSSIAGIALIILLISILSASNDNMVTLYEDLSVQESGQIKTELDTRGVKYEIVDNGTTIRVPSSEADTLLVDLAAKGIPDSGRIDYSFFAENSSWGVTDNEFDVMKLDAMQTELANLISQIDGIKSATVNLNIPKESLFLTDEQQESSAAIVLETEPGYAFDQNKINALYHLVSKSVPNLSTDNIVIMNQYVEFFDQNNQNLMSNGNTYESQQTIKRDFEKDIERRVQKMLGAMIGLDKVAVSATSDIDFTQENRVEQLVEQVDEDTESLPVSIETITESFTGQRPIDGEVGTGEGDIANYPAATDGAVGDYELVKESVNNEFNRIQKDIVESPYKIRDLGIQVAIDNTKTDENGEIVPLTAQEELEVEEAVASILNSIVTTSVDPTYGEVNPADNVSIVFQPFTAQVGGIQSSLPTIPLWVYIVGAALIIVIVVLIVMLRRRKQADEMMDEVTSETITDEEVPPLSVQDDTDASKRRKQLEQYAEEKPEEFAKLLRTWISEE